MDLLEFYGLKEDPFRLTPDPSYFFASANHNEALLSMNYAIEQREGFCLISGEPGVGKTTLLNVFMQTWKDKAEIAMILTPRLSPEEFLWSILDDLGLKLTSINKHDMLKAFRDFLVLKSKTGKPVIIIVDEAQNSPDETLEELRLLSNLETDKDKLLQIILIGQPELEERLTKENLRQLSQRITVRIRLHPLSGSETRDYINYRLIKAGKGFIKLDDKLLERIYKFSAGVPRVINILSAKTIMAAYIEGSNVATPKHVKYAIKHFKDTMSERNRDFRKSRLTYLVPVLFIVVAIAIGYYYHYFFEEPKSAGIEKVSGADKAAPPLIQDTNKIKGSATAPRAAVQGAAQSSVQDRQETQLPRKYVVVRVEALNIRVEPTVESKKIGMVYKGEKINILSEKRGEDGSKWYKIGIYDNKEGWIAGLGVTPFTD